MATQRTGPGARTATYWRLRGGLAGVLIGIFAVAGSTAGDQPSARKPIDFAHDIAPLIKAHCAECHTDGNYKGSFSLDTRETMLKSEAVVPGKSGESELLERLTSDDPEFRMPPKGKRLTAGEVARLKAWIDQGAPWDDGFTFKRSGLRRPRSSSIAPGCPRAQRPRPSHRPHRRRLLCRRAECHRPPPVGDAAFARRAFLDVIGLLPPRRELEAFEKDACPRQASAADPPAARRPPCLRRSLADLLERPAPQRLRRDRLHRRRPQADHRLALSVAHRQQALRPVRPRADQPVAGIGRVHQGNQVAGAGQRQPGPRDPVLAERLAGVLRDQYEVCLVPRQLHRPLEARRRLRPGGRDRRGAAGDRPLRQADRPDRRAQVPLARAGDDRRQPSPATSGWSGWPAW